MTEFFDKVRARRTVFKRTRKRDELPSAVLYVEWLGSENKRRVIDPEGNEHELTDKLIESNYKIVGKAEAKKLIEAHWKKHAAEKKEPVRKN